MTSSIQYPHRIHKFQYYLLFILGIIVGGSAYSSADANEDRGYGAITLFANETANHEIEVRLNVPKGFEEQEVSIIRCEGAIEYIGGSICEVEYEYYPNPIPPYYPPIQGDPINRFKVNTSEPAFIDDTIKPNTVYSYHLLNGDETIGLSSVFAATFNNGAQQYDSLVKGVDDNAVKFYFEPAPDEHIDQVNLHFSIDDQFHQTPILEYLERDDNVKLSDETVVAMTENPQTGTWEYVLNNVTPQTKIDYEFVYQSDSLKGRQETPASSYILGGLIPPLARRYVEDEVTNQELDIRWQPIPALKSNEPVTYEVYFREVASDGTPYAWQLLTDEPLETPEFVHHVPEGRYYDYVIVTKEGGYQSLPSLIFRTKTAYVSSIPRSEPVINSDKDVPGAVYYLDGPGHSTSKPPILFVQGQGDVAQSWWSQTLSGVNDMTLLAAQDNYRMAFIQLNDKDPKADNSLESNAALLAEKLPEIYNHFGEKVNIVAHGKGGVDVNYALTKLGAYPYVDKVIALSSPFQGSRLADAGLSWYAQPAQQAEQNATSPATKSMQRGYMQKVRGELDANPNMLENEYFTIAGEVKSDESSESSKLADILTYIGIPLLVIGVLGALPFFGAVPVILVGLELVVAGVIGGSFVVGFSLLAAGLALTNDGRHSEDEVQLPPPSSCIPGDPQNPPNDCKPQPPRNPHVGTFSFTYDNIRMGNQTYSLIDNILSCPAGVDVFDCTGLEKPDDQLSFLNEEEAKLPESLVRGGVVEPHQKQTDSFPVESGNDDIFVSIGLSSDYAQVKLTAPSGQTYSKWSEEIRGPARFIPGIGVTQTYWIEKPEIGEWTVEFQTDEESSYNVSVYFDGSDAMDLTLSELEELLHSTEPGQDITIGINAIRQEPEDSDYLDIQALEDQTFYNVTFDISGNSEHGYFERTVVKTYDYDSYQAIIQPETLTKSAKRSAFEISEQALKGMSLQQLGKLMQDNHS